MIDSHPSRRRFLGIALSGFAASTVLRASEGTSAPASGRFICVTCGTQYPRSGSPPASCPICEDERQYIGAGGQRWTTLETMRGEKWRNVIRQLEPGLWSITTEPRFGIGQRALLLQTPRGNVLWDCVTLLDDETIRGIRKLGGIHVIAISHPHYYTTMVEWSRAFGDAPVHLHEADRRWVMRTDPCIRFWSGDAKPLDQGPVLVHTGGHFDGFQVLHWAQGAEGAGVLLSGDQPQIAADPRWVSFMFSYPNYVPLNATAIRGIMRALEPLRYDRIYSAFTPGIVAGDAAAVVRRSAERYLKAIAG